MNADAVRAIVVVVTRQIGDVLLTTPLIRAAKTRWPGAAIDVLGFEGTLGMLRGNADVREAIAMPARLGLAGTLRWLGRLWKRYDLALIADVGDRAHILGAVAARARAGIVPEQSGSNWWKKALLEHVVTASGDLGEVHVVREKVSLIEPWQRAPSPARVIAPPGAPLPSALQARLAPGYVVVHAPSMWPYKQWPPSHFRELVSRLADAQRQVVLTGGPSPQDRELVASLADAAPGRAIDAGLLDFQQLVTLIGGAALYIGPDTSISHLAAACDVPMIAIFGPTNPLRWAPWPAAPAETPVRFVRRAAMQSVGSLTLMQDTRDCVPCGKAGCDDHRQSGTQCLPAITPERVAARAFELLREPRA